MEAAPAVALVIALQVVLALVSRADWTLSGLPWWVWLIPSARVLLVPLAWERRAAARAAGQRRRFALVLLALVSLSNALLLLAVIASLVRGDEKSGGQLLLKASPSGART